MAGRTGCFGLAAVGLLLASPTHAQTLPGPGALAGKTVYMAPGHGWRWTGDGGPWAPQRTNPLGVNEDFVNADHITQFLIPYLEDAGADVWSTRDRCPYGIEVIVDNDGGSPDYTDDGNWVTISTGGYQGGSFRLHVADGSGSSWAEFTPDIPAEGNYPLYVWYAGGPNSAPEVVVEVHHSGGVSRRKIDQTAHGKVFRYVGTYYWLAGRSQRVRITSESASSGDVVVADAIRIGGGMGSIERGGTTSGRPRYEEASRYWAEYMGAPPTVYDTSSGVDDMADDWACTGAYAAWIKTKHPGEDPVWIGWHMNAWHQPSPNRGTETFIRPNIPGSDVLQAKIHGELIGDLRAAWNPQWYDAGMQAGPGAMPPYEVGNIPAVTVEIAYYDRPDESAALRDPRFCRIAARAVYQGIVRYFAERDGAPALLAPEPPTDLYVRAAGPTSIEVGWHDPPVGDPGGDAATGYLIELSPNGLAFDDGQYVADDPGGPAQSIVIGGLAPGELRFVRLRATNDGGRSWPTEVLAVRTPAEGGASGVLIVNGFDRLDGESGILVDDPDLGTAWRLIRDRRMNSGDYCIEHANAMIAARAKISLDGASNEAVVGGSINLADYSLADWLLGKESVADETFSQAERLLLAGFLDGGGAALISGSDVGFDLDFNGSADDATFYHPYLKAQYVEDDAESLAVSGIAGSIFEGLDALTLDDGTAGLYSVQAPDGITGVSGGIAALSYDGASSAAGVQYAGAYRLVYVAFPLESVYPDASRAELFDRSVDFLLPCDACECNDPTFDMDADGDVDGEDFGVFELCFNGALPTGPGCECMDVDGDGDVDGEDFGVFGMCYNGGLPTDPTCDDLP